MANPILTSDILQDDGALTKAIGQLKDVKSQINKLKKEIQKLAKVSKSGLANLSPSTKQGQAGIKSQAKHIDELSKQLNKYNDQLKNNSIRIEKLKALQADLRKQRKLEAEIVQSQGGSLKNLNAQIKLNQQELNKLNKASQENTKTGKALAALNVELKAKQKALIDEQRKATKVAQLEHKIRKSAIGSYDRLSAQYSLNKIKLNEMSAAERSGTKSGRLLEKQTKKIYLEMDRLQKRTGKATLSVGKYSNALKGIGSKLISAFGLVGVVQGAANQLRSAANAAIEFESSVSKLASITGLAGEELDSLAEKAKDISRAYGTSAKDVIDAFGLIGSKNPELLKNAEALAEVTKQAEILSKAAGIDLPQAGNALAGFLNIFKKDASEAAQFADILATSQQKGTSRVEELTEAFKTVGPVLRATNINFEQGNALLQGLAKGGFEGAEAGTKLRNILISLSKTGREELNPATQDFNNILTILSKEVTSVGAATDLFKKQNAAAALALIDNRDAVLSLSGALNEQGNALDQANTNTDNLRGSLDKLGNAWTLFTSRLFSGESRLGQFLSKTVKELNSILDDIALIDKQQSTTGSKNLRERIRNAASSGSAIPGQLGNKGTFGDQIEVAFGAGGNDAAAVVKELDKKLESDLEVLNDKLKDASFFTLKRSLETVADSYLEAGYTETVARDAASKFIDKILKARGEVAGVDGLDTIDSNDKSSTKNEIKKAETGINLLKKQLNDLNDAYNKADLNDTDLITAIAGDIVRKEAELKSFGEELERIKNRIKAESREEVKAVDSIAPPNLVVDSLESNKDPLGLAQRREISKKVSDLNKKNQKEEQERRKKELEDEEELAKRKKEILSESIKYATNQISQLAAARTAAAQQAVNDANAEVQSAENAVQSEIANRNAGYANNVETAQKELAAAKENQKKALEERRKAQRAELALQSVEQASNLVTASAKIWKDLSFPAALPAIGIMWGSFIASKIRAAQLTKKKFAKGGLEIIGGGSHASGNDTYLGFQSEGKAAYGERGEAHMILNKKRTAQYKNVLPTIFNSLDQGNFDKIFNAHDSAIKADIKYNSSLSTDKMENELMRIRKQGEISYYNDNGVTVRRYRNKTTRIHGSK